MDVLEEELQQARANATRKGEEVRKLKKEQKVDREQLNRAIDELQALKLCVVNLEKQLEDSKPLYTKCKDKLDNLLKRRFFIAPAFEIYGSASGLYDYGPPGCAVKTELESLWRRHFVLHEGMQEISATCLTPHAVLKTSGHVDRFTDLMVTDLASGECYRADKLLEEYVDMRNADPKGLPHAEAHRLTLLKRQADSLNAEQMTTVIADEGIKSPTGGGLSAAYPFNLMFKTKLGPKEDGPKQSSPAPDKEGDKEAEQQEAGGGKKNGGSKEDAKPKEKGGKKQGAATPDVDVLSGTAYLRPETAQGIFVNFRRLYEQNNKCMPFAAAQMGLGFRNEIAPRNGLLRVREFQMAEIEHFVNPNDKAHKRFGDVKTICLPLYPRKSQLGDGKVEKNVTLEEAVASRTIDNETLAYFMGRTYLFLINCGIQPQGLRFRQHLDTEMAHYASDCWDAEIETSYGWVECVGHADRSAFDLTRHAEESKVDLLAAEVLDPPVVEEVVRLCANKQLMGPKFKQKASEILECLEAKNNEQRLSIEDQLAAAGVYELRTCNGESFELSRDMVRFTKETVKVSERTYVPGVIEPSFGVGRILYSVFEHTFRSRGIENQEERCYLALPPRLAPIKCSILPLSANAAFEPHLLSLKRDISNAGLSSKIDSSGVTVGKRYARTDEIGIPFGVTVDFQSLKDNTVTLRERDSMAQIRIPMYDVAEVLRSLVEGHKQWEEVADAYPPFTSQLEEA